MDIFSLTLNFKGLESPSSQSASFPVFQGIESECDSLEQGYIRWCGTCVDKTHIYPGNWNRKWVETLQNFIAQGWGKGDS